jgi:hypothetical protein
MSAALTDLAVLLTADLDTILTAATDMSCTPDVIQYTAGEPAAPVGSCTTVSVWIAELDNIGDQAPFLRQASEVSCVDRPGVSMRIRVDVCYEDTETGDITAAAHATVADCLYDLMAAIWCGIADMRAAGTLMGLDCRQTSLGDFIVGQRSGGIVSATLTLEVEHDCAGATS